MKRKEYPKEYENFLIENRDNILNLPNEDEFEVSKDIIDLCNNNFELRCSSKFLKYESCKFKIGNVNQYIHINSMKDLKMKYQKSEDIVCLALILTHFSHMLYENQK